MSRSTLSLYLFIWLLLTFVVVFQLFVQGTTEQQLKDLFGQHATVISIIMKGTFSFVNTTDKDAAVIARSSLGGSQLNGGAMRINFAKETGRLGTSFDSTYGPAGASASTYGRY